ncbi:Receptor-like protein kinase [Morella rubra]|uniref:Receptor-like protein kinase n=1 Tax=Morella rubra TaxID=262757 RepID=A0A6A1X055_9ROSI|nr:Receptor-like protein kinase [Morella rubra]
MGLAGTIPPHVGNLSFLVWVSAANNSFHGSVPNELTRLYRLKRLDLRFNSFNGEIPSSVGLLHRLQLLSLRGNSFTVPIPASLCNLSSLQEINLGSNKLTGFIPSSIFNLSSLQIIFVEVNSLSGPMPSIFFHVPSLRLISVSENKLFGELSGYMFLHLPNLQGIDVLSNQFYGEVPSTLFKGKQLSFLELSDNQFKGTLLPEIGNLTIAHLYLEKNNFEDMKVLRVLDFSRNKLSGIIPTTIGGLQELVNLSLEENQLKGSIPESLGKLVANTRSARCIILDKMLEKEGRIFISVRIAAFSNVEKSFPMNFYKQQMGLVNMDFKAFVLEYMPNGNPDMWLHFDNRFLTLLQRLNIMIDVAVALEYLHFGNPAPIVHCDLKPNNVLLDEDMVAHVADFGIAKLLGDGDSLSQTMTLTTIGYMAPVTEVSDADVLRNENVYATTNDCLSSVLGLALVCCADLPKQRINMAGIQGVLKASAVLFFAYTGFDTMATWAEEVKSPGRDIPIGLVSSSMSITIVVYSLLAATLCLIQPYTQVDIPIGLVSSTRYLLSLT